MPKIAEEFFYNGAEEKIRRLGLSLLIEELRQAVTSFDLAILEEKNENSGAVLREMIDAELEKQRDWKKRVAGGIDWKRCQVINGINVCIGVEVQVSARSDLIIRDVVHLRREIIDGVIDLGIIVLPSDHLSYFLTNRAPSFSDGKRVVGEARADDLPLMLIAIEHDGSSSKPLPKKRTKTGRKQEL